MKHKLEGLSQLILGCAYTFTLVALMAVIMYPEVPVLEIIAISIAAYLFISLIFMNRIVMGIFLGLTALMSLAATYVCWVETSISKPVLYIVEGIITVWYKLVYVLPLSQGPETLLFIRIFMMFAAVVASVLVVLLFKKHFSFLLLTGLNIAMFIFSWFMSAISSKLLFALLCTLTILSYIRHIYKKKRKQGLVADNLPLASYMLLSVPFALIPVIIVAFIPKHDQPIQWPWLDNKIMSVIDTFEQRYSYTNVEFFTLSSTGFTGRPQRLGGPVRPSNNVVMEVKAENRTYLRGAVYLNYENSSWSRVSEEEESPIYSLENENEIWETRNGWVNIPVSEMFKGINEDDKTILTNLSQRSLDELFFPTYALEVKFRNLITRTVFMPLKSIMPVKNANDEPMIINEDIHGAATTEAKLPSGSAYKLDYIQPMYGEPLLKKVLEYSRKDLYKDSIDLLLNQKEEMLEAYKLLIAGHSENPDQVFDSTALADLEKKISLLQILYQRAAEIEEKYTSLNDTVPQRVKDLAASLTKDCKSDYEKVVLIEKYLRENYVYTLNTKYVPENYDFVDYFLFEDNKGYCTYYATAMTVLLRSIGIPARYVEGYVLPDNANTNNVYTVSNRNAHAWTEVYFEGFGWLSFEPTAMYADIMNFRNETYAASGSTYPFDSAMEELMERYNQRESDWDYVPIDINNEIAVNPFVFTALILAALLVLSVLVSLSAALIDILGIRWLKGGRKVMKMYERMIRWLKLAGSSIKPGETVREFSKRIDSIYYYTDTNFKAVTEIFIKVRYGKREVSQEEIKLIQKFSGELRRQVLKELGIRRFIPLRNVFLGI